MDIEFVTKPKYSRDRIIIVRGRDDNFNREVLASKKIDILLDPHLGDRRDKLNQRDSGLNQVLCEIAKENKIAIGFSFNSLLNSYSLWRVLGRVIQNIKLCRKYRVEMVILPGERSLNDVESMFKVLGMDGKEIVKSKGFVSKRLDYKRRVVCKGVMLAK